MTGFDTMRIVILQGTARDGNYTQHAVTVVADEFERGHGADVTVVDPGELRLGFPGTGATADGERLRGLVEGSDGIVLATPEYHGTFSAMLKLMIENLGFPSLLSGKPIVLLGVAAGRIGAIKSLEHLRSVASHVGAIVLPGPVSIAGVRKVFDAEGRIADAAVEEQLRGLATRLVEYLRTRVCPVAALEAMVRG